MKKIILPLIIILILIAVGIGIYFGWQKSREILTPPDINNEIIGNNEQQAEITKPKLKVISDQPVFDYWASVSGEVFYINQQGRIFRTDDKEDELISDRNFDDLINIKVSENGTMLIIKYGGLNAPKFEIFDIDKKIWQLLADNITAADFSPDSSKLIYLEKMANDASNLIIKDMNSSKMKTSKILSLNQADFDLKWINSEKVLLMPASSIDYVGEIWEIDIKNKIFKPFLSGKSLMVKWSAESNFGLQFNSNGKLNLIDDTGNIKADIAILSLPDKCFLTINKIYCAIMQNYFNNLPQPSLPDDYLKKAFYSKDKIYAIDIADNSSEIILSDELPPAVDAVNLSLNENNLFFINRYDNMIYSLEL